MAAVSSSPPVKGVDTFFRVRGVIEGFKKPHRNISSGVENILDKLMGAVRFWNPPYI